MRDIEIPLPQGLNYDLVVRSLDDLITKDGWQITLRGSLKKFPGCVHWHLKKNGTSGTLEITVWPQKHRAWFTVQSGRDAPWVDNAIQRLTPLLQLQLARCLD